MEYKQAIYYICFSYFLVIMFILCYWYYQETGITILVALILFDIEFGYAQIHTLF